ncbi:hypothetical protein [Endozoicomonas sp. SCSIO W0465]|uniref:hypothetical protein n=1 Tax=Endozoicomonas sp. SCSIO W0465 TaxID=2918516 RepID=UPI002074E7CD|nr:hypothetical protein [Endozoicomonas sp. SCSIO W0465]USE33951.1 hypothetical protein MJO57_17450 [Endozoicomonas sp. SCSIO W0465]
MNNQSGIRPLTQTCHGSLLIGNPADTSTSDNVSAVSSYCRTGGVKRSASVVAAPCNLLSEASAKSPDIATPVKAHTLEQRELHSSLPLALELSDQVRKEVTRQLEASEKCNVFFLTDVWKKVRFTESAKQRMLDDEISQRDIDNALTTSEGEHEILDQSTPRSDGYYFVNSPKVNQHLAKSTYNNRCFPFYTPMIVFECLGRSNDRWEVAGYGISHEIPLPLVNSRYIKINEEVCGSDCCGVVEPQFSVSVEKYIADEVARRFSETLNVFYQNLNASMPDNEKVDFLYHLMTPQAPDHSPVYDAVGGDRKKHPEKPRLAADEFMYRIRFAPGGPAFNELCEKQPLYRQGTI